MMIRTGVVLAAVLGVVLAFSAPSDAPGQAADRHRLFTSLLNRYVNEEGLVDYKGFRDDPLFAQYLHLLDSLRPETLPSREEQFAFWINAYNAYTIKLIVDRMPLTSIRDISLGLPVMFGPWSIDVAAVGGEMLTLNEIEHDIIRERFQDGRLHFVLVCAAKGCPKLRREAYEGERLEQQLQEETRRFINDPARNRFDVSSGKAFLSSIFDWYEGDFEEWEKGILPFLARYVDRKEVQPMLLSGKCEIDFLPYDWSLNSQ